MKAGAIRWVFSACLVAILAVWVGAPLLAQAQEAAAQGATRHTGGEANLILPNLSTEKFMGVDGHTLLLAGILVAALGMIFGLVINRQLKNLPVHSSMLEIS